ncbi:hypothetical protein LINGRAHAP2_LOCUS34437 [Linum grandiflorum]
MASSSRRHLQQPHQGMSDSEFQSSPFATSRQTRSSSRRQEFENGKRKSPDVSGNLSGGVRAGNRDMHS